MCLLGPKLGDDVVSLSQLNAGSTFSYWEIFHKTFFFHQNPGVFSAIFLLSLYWCQVREASLALFPPVSSGLPRALFDSTVYILCCVLENVWVGGWSEFKVAVLFPRKLLVPVWGRWLETGFC